MFNVFGRRGRPKTKLASVLVFGIVLLFLVTDVSAQEINLFGPNTNYTIRVSRNAANMCVYEIVGYLDQDLFLIKPGGSIDFQAEGTDVRIEIGRHQKRGRHYGKPGLRKGQASSFTMRGGEAVTVNARDSIAVHGNNHTQHKVWIFCLNEEGEEELPENYLSSKGSSSLHKYAPDQNEFTYVDLRGPMTPAVRLMDIRTLRLDPPWRDTGGPTMEVDDP